MSKSSKNDLIERNRNLLNRINHLRQDIENFQSNNQEIIEMSSEDEENDNNLQLVEADLNLKPISDLKQLLDATEELTGIKFEEYSTKPLPTRENSGSGQWREVSINLLIDDWLRASVQFIENVDETIPIRSLQWSVNGFLTRSELNPLITQIGDNLPELFTRLREYALLAKNRSDVLQVFSHEYKNNFKIDQAERRILITWHRNLFQIEWYLRYCPYSEKIIDYFEIEINERHIDFRNASKKMFEDFLYGDKEVRSKALKNIGQCASMYMKQYL